MPPRRPGVSSHASFTSDSGSLSRPPLAPTRISSTSVQTATHPPPQPSAPPLLQGMAAAVVNGGAGPALLGGMMDQGAYVQSPGPQVQLPIGHPQHPSHPQHPNHPMWVHQQQQQQEREMQQAPQGMSHQQLQMQALHLRQQREQQQQQRQQQHQQQHEMLYSNGVPVQVVRNPQLGQMPSGPNAIAGGQIRLAGQDYQQQPHQLPPNQPQQPQNPAGQPQQRPIPISRPPSLQAQTPQQQLGLGPQPSPVQPNAAPAAAYRIVSQAGERVSPVQAGQAQRVLSGQSQGMHDSMRSSVGPSAQERGPPTPHPAILGSKLAAAGVGPISAIAAPVGPALAKLTQFNDALADALDYPPGQVLDELRRVVDDHFAPNGVLKYGLYDKANGLNKMFEVPCAALPRFAHINALCGVRRQSTLPSFVREFLLSTPDPGTRQPVHVGFLLKAEEVSWVSRYRSGVQVELLGSLQVHFVVVGPSAGTGASAVALKIESLSFESKGHEELISREMIINERVEKILDSFANHDANGAHSGNNSPVLGKGRAQRKAALGSRRKSQMLDEDDDGEGGKLGSERAPGIAGVSFEKTVLPPSPVGSFGIPEMGMRCLEIAESVAQLQDLIAFSLENQLGPVESLRKIADSFRSSQAHFQPQQLPGHLASSVQTNNFYSSVGPPPDSVGSPQPLSAISSGMPSARPLSRGPADSPQSVMGTLKRKAGGPPPNGAPPRTPTPAGMGDMSMGEIKNEYTPNGSINPAQMEWQGGGHGPSPVKVARGGGGAGRGRGRGRGGVS